MLKSRRAARRATQSSPARANAILAKFIFRALSRSAGYLHRAGAFLLMLPGFAIASIDVQAARRIAGADKRKRRITGDLLGRRSLAADQALRSAAGWLDAPASTRPTARGRPGWRAYNIEETAFSGLDARTRTYAHTHMQHAHATHEAVCTTITCVWMGTYPIETEK